MTTKLERFSPKIAEAFLEALFARLLHDDFKNRPLVKRRRRNVSAHPALSFS
jgi:hypothetical protein